MLGHLSKPFGIEAIPTDERRARPARVAVGVPRMVDRGCGKVCER